MSIFETSIRKEDKERSITGDLIIIIAALFYSVYAILLKYFSKKYKQDFDMMEVFGYIGLYNLIITPLILIILHFTQLEEVVIPTLNGFLLIFLNALFAGLISDLCMSYSVILLSPHIVSFGLIFTSPLSLLYDYLIGNIEINIYYLMGSSLMIISILIVFYENLIKIRNKKLNKS